MVAGSAGDATSAAAINVLTPRAAPNKITVNFTLATLLLSHLTTVPEARDLASQRKPQSPREAIVKANDRSGPQ